jgi:hypothetical protein
LPYAVRVKTAEVSNRDGGIETLRSSAPNLREVVKVQCEGGERGGTPGR